MVHLGLGHSCISTSELVSVVVQVRWSSPFIVNLTDFYWPAWGLASGTSSLTSENSAILISMKNTCPKHIVSDEDVWNHTDMRIIGMHADPACVLLISNLAM